MEFSPFFSTALSSSLVSLPQSRSWNDSFSEFGFFSNLSQQQYCVFSCRHIFDSAMLSLALLDVLTGLIATPIVTLVYYYDCELDFIWITAIFYHLPQMREAGVETRWGISLHICHRLQTQVLLPLLETPCMLVVSSEMKPKVGRGLRFPPKLLEAKSILFLNLNRGSHNFAEEQLNITNLWLLTDWEPGLVQLEMDPDQLLQVLNLLAHLLHHPHKI